MFQIAAKKTAAVTTDTEMTVCTLATAARAVMATGAFCANSAIKYVKISSGNIVAYGTWPANTTFIFYATYITAN